ncbi:hypothetical protein LBMAG53_27570 [Planctomycetota bacterium]|nr:hypothetical protein LBMAG53_27570 [Planctomycetota bacterium]
MNTKRIVEFEIVRTPFDNTDYVLGHNVFQINANTLGDVLDAIPTILPIRLVPRVDKGKWWIMQSENMKINGKMIDIHFKLPRGKSDDYICPKHDISAIIPDGASVWAGIIIC